MSSTTKIFLTFLQAILLIILPAVVGAFSNLADHEVKCVERERQALIQFKAGLIDDHAQLHSWETVKDCCQWEGVVCDNRTTHIIALDLSGYQHLRGNMVHPSLLELHELNHLDLSFTNFRGIEIPAFIGSLRKLQYLNLSYCDFAGMIPQSLSNGSMLRFLDLGGNYMVSNDLDWLSGLQLLEYLDLSFTDCSGIEIPASIGSLRKLQFLNLSYCHFYGMIPQSLSNVSMLRFIDLRENYMVSNDLDWLSGLQSLEYLDLGSNDFRGIEIPACIGSLHKLQFLNLSYCGFAGMIPQSLSNLSMLQFLYLRNNDMVRANDLDWLSSLQSLEYLDLSSIDLSKAKGWLQQIMKLPMLKEIHLGDCSLSSALPTSQILNISSRLSYIDLSFNDLDWGTLDFLKFFVSLSHLDLSFNIHMGRIPSALGNLTSLFHLDLSNNQLQDSILLEHLRLLSYLDLSHNQLQGELTHLMKQIGNSTMLEHIDLSHNVLFGCLPNMSRFQYLKELKLNDNNLNESLPQHNLSLPFLEVLDMSSNMLIGSVPNLSSCLSLRQLLLNDNMFGGTLTEAHLFNLSKLEELDLSRNSNLTVRISNFWNPPFQLSYLRLGSCTLGPHFPMWLQTQRNIAELDVSNAKIADAIPNWFWNNKQYSPILLNMSHNDIHGTLPDLLTKFDDLYSLDLSFNQLTGTLPKLPRFVEINFSENRFSGSIMNICSFEGKYGFLDVSNNQLSGKITPYCFMNFTRMFYINLANNNLSGNIQANHSSRCYLFSLHLRNNSFTGEIPNSLGGCNYLIFLDLGENKFNGNIPIWLGESLPNLIVLSLKSNELHGSLPSSLCQLSGIQVLDISMNKVSGTIPKCLNNFTMLSAKSNISSMGPDMWGLWLTENVTSIHDSASVMWKGKVAEYINTLWMLKAIDFSSNKLSGEIPHDITSLTELISLNLSRNNLTGSIPKDMNQLGLLNSLDFSRNHLSGNIPSTLSQLSHLGVLDLSFNNLFGKIPWDTHMDTFSASSYIGNPGLCGAPLISKPCPDDVDKKPNKADKTEHGNMLHSKEFYISSVLGFCVAFWGVCWALFFNKMWNVGTNRMIICVEDWLYVNTLLSKRRLQRYFGNC